MGSNADSIVKKNRIKRYKTRRTQRFVIEKLGLVFAIFGGLMAIIGLFFIQNNPIIAFFGQTAFYFGCLCLLIFNRLGWSDNVFVDLLFNQIGFLLVIVGFMLMFVHDVYMVLSMDIGFPIVVIGVVFSGVGIIISSDAPSSDR